MARSRIISAIFLFCLTILGINAQAEIVDGATGGLLDGVVGTVDDLLGGVLGGSLDGATGTVGSVTDTTGTVGSVTKITGTVASTVTSGSGSAVATACSTCGTSTKTSSTSSSGTSLLNNVPVVSDAPGSGDVTSVLEPIIGPVVGTVGELVPTLTSGVVSGAAGGVVGGVVGSTTGGEVTSIVKDVPVVGGVTGGSGLEDTVTSTADGRVTSFSYSGGDTTEIVDSITDNLSPADTSTLTPILPGVVPELVDNVRKIVSDVVDDNNDGDTVSVGDVIKETVDTVGDVLDDTQWGIESR